MQAFLPTPFIAEDAVYSEANRALGPPDGRTVALGDGAFIILRFTRPVRDGEGQDLRIHEVGPDGSRARVAVSDDGEHFYEFAEPATGLTTDYDISESGLERAAFVRIRGLDDAGEEPGFDLDAVEALF